MLPANSGFSGFCTITVVSELATSHWEMTKTQEEALRRELTELGSVVRTYANKNDGVEQSVRAIEHRQENIDKAIRNLDKKYEGMMNMMAQIMAKLNDKGKEVGGSSSERETRIEITTDT